VISFFSYEATFGANRGMRLAISEGFEGVNMIGVDSSGGVGSGGLGSDSVAGVCSKSYSAEADNDNDCEDYGDDSFHLDLYAHGLPFRALPVKNFFDVKVINLKDIRSPSQ
jgi:hypothetical protein